MAGGVAYCMAVLWPILWEGQQDQTCTIISTMYKTDFFLMFWIDVNKPLACWDMLRAQNEVTCRSNKVTNNYSLHYF